jgi:hypothetical protein
MEENEWSKEAALKTSYMQALQSKSNDWWKSEIA